MATKGRHPRLSVPRAKPPKPPKPAKGKVTGRHNGGPSAEPRTRPEVVFSFSLENLTEAGRKAQEGEAVHDSGTGDHRRKILIVGPAARVYGEVPEPYRTRMHNHGDPFAGEVVNVVAKEDGSQVTVRVKAD